MSTAASFTTRIERTQCPPWGLQGGKDALPNRVYVRRADGSVEQPPNGKIDLMQLNAGDTYVLESGVKLWVITEHDRSVTTLLLPEEYVRHEVT